jgi:hypothetical protein
MGGTALRTTLIAGGALAASLVGASFALAQNAGSQVDFTDPVAAIREGADAALNLSVRDDAAQRFAPNDATAPDSERRRLELELAAGGGDSPLDVSIAQRATLGADANGDVARRGSGSELRVGRGLVRERGENDTEPSVYMFVASDDEALTWRPGARSEFGGRGSSFGLQDRVEVGDVSAGVTYEQNGVQASLAYVEREESTRVGTQNFSQDESFTGVTVTVRR